MGRKCRRGDTCPLFCRRHVGVPKTDEEAPEKRLKSGLPELRAPGRTDCSTVQDPSHISRAASLSRGHIRLWALPAPPLHLSPLGDPPR